MKSPIWKPNTNAVPGGFMLKHKRRNPTMTAIKDAAIQALNRRIVRGTDVHP